MKLYNLFVFSLSGLSCIFLLLYAIFLGDSTWATVAITGILVIITAYYAIATEKILEVNAHYAKTTDKILTVNQRTLELLIVQKRSPKIEEIARTIIIPFDKEIKTLINAIKDKSNVVVINPTINRIHFRLLKNNIRYLTSLDRINAQFENIKIDRSYEDPIFQKYIQPILKSIEDYDNEERNYEIFIRANISEHYQKVFPFMEKVVKNYKTTATPKINAPIKIIPAHIDYDFLFKLLMKGNLDSAIESQIIRRDPSNIFLMECQGFLNDCYQNATEFRLFIEKKSEREERLIEKLELLSTELDRLLSEWMNVYHIVIT